MQNVTRVFDGLVSRLAGKAGVEAGQMFGKRCAKAGGKAFIAEHDGRVVFKLTGVLHARALGEKGAELWDPSGKSRPMKEWVAIPERSKFDAPMYAEAAYAYVSGKTG